jgi:hypothetical protein
MGVNQPNYNWMAPSCTQFDGSWKNLPININLEAFSLNFGAP